jgi:hypothetical protein
MTLDIPCPTLLEQFFGSVKVAHRSPFSRPSLTSSQKKPEKNQQKPLDPRKKTGKDKLGTFQLWNHKSAKSTLHFSTF